MSVEIIGEEIFAVGDNECIFVFRQQDLEIERMIKTENSRIWCIGHVQQDQEQIMYTIGDCGTI